ncbi:MAG TPA: EcsC family protein [Ignavibacteria bacterium]|nr:EcsC family protein [Ignavibacteria bacterium]HRF66367.1 EcsC family protein [Ignavibacteria bacterium]HRJ04345.1 EcsC family protein [Ignavibacteria bacterium]HRJ86672.1 EcsC family protein [Ignavibacteria bacterium]
MLLSYSGKSISIAELIYMEQLQSRELAELKRAKKLLENPNLAIEITNYIGVPIEKAMKLLPEKAHTVISKASREALLKALEYSMVTILDKQKIRTSKKINKLLTTISGGIGGAFGLAAIPIELPVSTMLILKSIAEIAKSEGHDINTIETKLSCIEVFALGGNSKKDDASDNSYWVMRAVMAKEISSAAKYLGQKGFAKESAPAIVKLVNKIVARYSVVITEEVAAKAVPIVGAVSGAGINLIFMDHFQKMAEGHFTVKRLEKKYGAEAVRLAYAEV